MKPLVERLRKRRNLEPSHVDAPKNAVEVPDIDCQEAADEIDRLRRDCAEFYQVIGTMSEHCPDPDDPAIIKALDNASNAASGAPRQHDDLLPFILPEPKRV